MALIETSGLTRIYRTPGGEVRALDGVDLMIQAGEFAAIVGQSGSGKSTLMNLLGCLDVATAGSYRLQGEEVSALSEDRRAAIRNRTIGFVFQGFDLIGGLSALENVELPLCYRRMPREHRRTLAAEALERVGLSHRLHHRPTQLSGGQQQRVAIARAIAAQPPILLADEPTGNLDSHAGEEVMALLRELHREGHTVLLITHDPAIAAAAPRTIRIHDGRLIADSAAIKNPPT